MLKKLAKQFRKPEGFLGRLVAIYMERNNQLAYDWMLTIMHLQERDKVLEVGYGSGAIIHTLANTFKQVSIYGIDFSKLMFEKATKKNKKHINNKQVILSYGDLLHYTETHEFNKIFGINVLYFWPDLLPYFAKLKSLLKKNGVLYLSMSSPERLNKIPFTHNEIFNKHTIKEVILALQKSKFRNVSYETKVTPMGDVYCLIARK